MKTKRFLFFILFIFNIGWSQTDSTFIYKNANISKDLEKKSKAWLDNIYTSNVIVKDSSITYNAEAKRILADTLYHKLIYPAVYTWKSAIILMKKKAVKQAIWYMINLYGKDRTANGNYVMKMVFTLDQSLDMEKVLISSYYSYISFDPDVVKIENGQIIKYIRPDLAEQKLNNVKEITALLLNNRKDKTLAKNKN